MPSVPSLRRQFRAVGAATPWLLVASGLLGAGCGQTPPSASPARMAAAANGDDDSFRLFPSGPDFRLSTEAAVILGRPSRPAAGPVGSAPMIASFPRSSSGLPARRSPSDRPPFRTAERLDGGATTVR